MTTTASTTAASKAQLRRLIAGRLKGLSEAEKRRQSESVFEKLVNHPKFREAQKISLYLSTTNEIDTESILRHSLELTGKRCFIPFIKTPAERELGVVGQQRQPAPRMAMVELRSMDEYEKLPRNRFGIREPRLGPMSAEDQFTLARPESGDLDLVVVPGVAFSLDGRRLGHGKGYYDEFLSSWSSIQNSGPASPHQRHDRQRSPYSIGLAFREQIVDEPLANDDHDYVLDEVLVANGDPAAN